MARWTTLGGYPVKQYDSPNRGGRMDGHNGVVCHIAEGTYLGTISWQMNPDQRYASGQSVTTSSTWIVGRAHGEIAQMVDTDEIAWCQRAGSRTWLSIEFGGHNTQALTEWQIEAAALILAKVGEHYGVPLQVAPDPSVRGLGHHSMDREWLGEEWGHEDCPGPQIIAQKPQIVAKAIAIVNGDDMDANQARQLNDIWYALFKDSGPDRPAASVTGELDADAERDAVAASKLDELLARPPVQSAPVDPATLRAVLLDPEVLAAIGAAALAAYKAEIND